MDFFVETLDAARLRGHATVGSGPLSYQDPRGRFSFSAQGFWHDLPQPDFPNTASFAEMQRQLIISLHVRDVPAGTDVRRAAKEGESRFQSLKGWNAWKEERGLQGPFFREKTSYLRSSHDALAEGASTAAELVHAVFGDAHVLLVVRGDPEKAAQLDRVAVELMSAFSAGGAGFASAPLGGAAGFPTLPNPAQPGFAGAGAGFPPAPTGFPSLPNPGAPQAGFPNLPNPQQGGFPAPGGIPSAQPGFPAQGGFPNLPNPQQGGFPTLPNPAQAAPQAGFPNLPTPQQGGFPSLPNPQQPGLPPLPNPQSAGAPPFPGLPTQPGFPAQAPSQAGFPNLPGPHSAPQGGFPTNPAQGGFPNLPNPQQAGFPNAQNPAHAAPQAGFPNLPSPQQGGFPNAPNPMQPGFPAQAGFPDPAHTAQPAGFPSLPTPQQGGFPAPGVAPNAQPAPHAAFPNTANPAQPGFPTAPQQGGFPNLSNPAQASPHAGFPNLPGPQQGGFPNAPNPAQAAPQAGFPQPGAPQINPAQPGFPVQANPAVAPHAAPGAPNPSQVGAVLGGILGALRGATNQHPTQSTNPAAPHHAHAATTQHAQQASSALSFASLSISLVLPASWQVAEQWNDGALLTSSKEPGALLVHAGFYPEVGGLPLALARLFHERRYQNMNVVEAFREESTGRYRAAFSGQNAQGQAMVAQLVALRSPQGALLAALALASPQNMSRVTDDLGLLAQGAHFGVITPNAQASAALVGAWSSGQTQYRFSQDGTFQRQGSVQGGLGAVLGALGAAAGSEAGYFFVAHGALVLASAQGSRVLPLRHEGNNLSMAGEAFVKA